MMLALLQRLWDARERSSRVLFATAVMVLGHRASSDHRRANGSVSHDAVATWISRLR
jgi:hypothetical protein